MGNVFKAPKPAKLPAPAPAVDPDEKERQLRLETLARIRRGRAGTIATSPRGLLVVSDFSANRKSLLGQ
jgi:hypothetical protein